VLEIASCGSTAPRALKSFRAAGWLNERCRRLARISSAQSPRPNLDSRCPHPPAHEAHRKSVKHCGLFDSKVRRGRSGDVSLATVRPAAGDAEPCPAPKGFACRADWYFAAQGSCGRMPRQGPHNHDEESQKRKQNARPMRLRLEAFFAWLRLALAGKGPRLQRSSAACWSVDG
jgi:hypothetical protein